jgi:hypothetical protein
MPRKSRVPSWEHARLDDTPGECVDGWEPAVIDDGWDGAVVMHDRRGRPSVLASDMALYVRCLEQTGSKAAAEKMFRADVMKQKVEKDRARQRLRAVQKKCSGK